MTRRGKGARAVAAWACGLSLSAGLLACEAMPTTPSGDGGNAAPPAGRPVAFVAGKPVTLGGLSPAMLETAGGDALFDKVLDAAVAERLDALGLRVTDADVDAEREALLRSLDASDDDRAMRLLARLRERRGLGRARFDALLRRNAGLAKLIEADAASAAADPYAVGDAEVQLAYAASYGRRTQVRLAVLPTLAEARDLRQAVLASTRPEARFIELAVERSTDPSAARGGLLAAVSPADTAFPAAFRQAVRSLQEADAGRGAVSPVISLEAGFAVVQVVRDVPASETPLAEVRDEIERSLRRRQRAEAIDALARRLVAEAEVVVLDDALAEAWRRRLAATPGP